MAIFQFKDKDYEVSPPQDGTHSIKNLYTFDSTYKQDISNLPTTSITSSSININALGVIALQISVGGNIGDEELRSLLMSNFAGYAYLNIQENGRVSSADALEWARIAIGTASNLDRTQVRRITALTKALEENYDQFKDFVFTTGGRDFPLYRGAPNEGAGFFDPNQHYIVVDDDDPMDRLKLIKYNQKLGFNSSYWYNTGTGSPVPSEGLEPIAGKATKVAGKSRITGKTFRFDGSDSSIISTVNNTIKLTGHGYATGDIINYELGILHTFSQGDSTVVNVGANTITITDHGYVTGDKIVYKVTTNSVPIAPFREENYLEVVRIDDDTISLRERGGGSTIAFTGLGFGDGTLSSVKPSGLEASNDDNISRYYVINYDADNIRLAEDATDAAAGTFLSIGSVGKGSNHTITTDFLSEIAPGDFLGVFEEFPFVASASTVDTTNNQITIPGHGFSSGDSVFYNRDLISGSISSDLKEGLQYYVHKINENVITLHTDFLSGFLNLNPINLNSTGSGTHTLSIEFGTKAYKVEDNGTVFINTSTDFQFSNRVLRKPNFVLDPAKDVVVAKVFKYETTGFCNSANVDSKSLIINDVLGEIPKIGSTISGPSVTGTPTITSIEAPSVSGFAVRLELELSTNQTIPQNEALTITTFDFEPYVTLDSGDRLIEDNAPQLGGDLDLNGNNITDGTNSVNSIVTSTNNIANNNNNTSLPTSAAVVSYTDANYLKSNADDTFTGRLTINGDVIFDPSLYTRTPAPNQPEPFVGFKVVDQSTDTTGISFYEKVHLGAYGLYLTGDNDMSSSRKAFIKTGNEHQLYIDNAIARINSSYYLNLATTGLGLRINGEIYANQDYRAGYFKSFRPNTNYQAYLGESAYRFQSLYASYGYFTGLDVTSYIRLSDSDNLYWGTSYDTRMFYDGSANTLNLRLNTQVNSFNINENSTTRFTFAPDTGVFTCTSVTESSDERLKSNIKTLEGKKVLQMRGVTFERNNGTHSSGVIAQEIEKIAPEIVSEDDKGYKSVAYSQLTGYLIEAVKDQQKQIDELKNLVQSLMEK